MLSNILEKDLLLLGEHFLMDGAETENGLKPLKTLKGHNDHVE